MRFIQRGVGLKWICSISAICGITALLLASIALGDEFPLPGEWPCYRGNSRLDGHAEGIGQITEPTILWKYRYSYDTVHGRVVANGTSANAEAIDVNQSDRSARRRLGLTSRPEGDIAGSIQPIEHTPTTTFADILPDVPGLEKIWFPSSFALPTKDGKWQYGPGQLLAWRNGQWNVEWQIDDVGHTFSPCPLVGDFDSDGKLEIAALPWYDLRVYDAGTGRLEQQCAFTSGRSYGFFGVYDFDGDGLSEFLVLADFSKHFEVLGYRDGKLELFWQDEIELDIADPQTIVHVLPEPVTDLDDDGRSEVVVAVFNKLGDQRWHTYVLDGMTGRVRADIVDERIQGIADLDGDGRNEMLLVATNGPHTPDLGTIRVRRLEGDSTSVVWERSRSGWQDHEADVALHRHCDAAYGLRTVLTRWVGDRDVAVVRHVEADAPARAVSLAECDSGELVLGPTLVAEGAQAVGLDEQGNMIVEVECPPGQEPVVDIRGGTFEPLGKRAPAQRALTPAIVIQPGDCDHAQVVVQDTSTSLSWVTIEPPMEHAPPHEQRRLTSRGQDPLPGRAHGRSDSKDAASMLPIEGVSPINLSEIQHSLQGPVAADLYGDGRRQLVVAAATDAGLAQLVAVDAESGTANWSREFERFSAGRIGWNPGGPLIWQSAYLTNQQHQDVLITLRRSRMHSEETYAVSGRSGQTIWHRDREIAGRSFGGQYFACADFDTDGLDDLASFYTHIRYIVDGATGIDLLAEENNWLGIPPSPVYWGQPVAGRFGPSHEMSLLFTTTGRQMIGLVRLDGSLAWSDAYDVAPNGFPAIGDFDGDQQTEAMFFGFDDGVRCYHTATGERGWTLSIASDHFTDAVSGDLDGDQRDEAVVASGNTLYCLGTDPDSHQGRVEWQITLPTTLSSPIIADVQSAPCEAGHQLSVLVNGQDGTVYCIGQQDVPTK